MTKLEALGEAAEAVKRSAKAGLDWLNAADNRKLVGTQSARMERELRMGCVLAGRLAEAARRPMAVAVFGASQVGKSHLISVLARKGDALLASFPGMAEPVNYITQINPDRGKEATGLVTRFTVRRGVPGPAGFPVHLRLLSHADVVKILANAYFFDGTPGRYETWPEREEIEDFVAPFREAAGAPDARNGLSAEDIWEIEDYFKRTLGEFELTKRLGSFWHVAVEAAPRLPLPRLAEFLSILWGRHAKITEVYLALIGGLQQLGFAQDAFAPFSAIDIAQPDVKSILDVEALGDLAEPGSARLELRGAGGAAADLPRPVVTALTAELVMTLADKPWDFFDQTDLLDFPGYRTRGLPQNAEIEDKADGPRGLALHLDRAPRETVAALLLRGKVEYLFQRYAAEQEITAMLLCVKESNLDVPQLAEVVSNWVASTHGPRPADRSGLAPLLFFVFTRFDMHFEKKTSDSAMGLSTRFEGRMLASLVKPFGANADTWVQQWTPGRAFRNCFLMRNPNVLNGEMFVFDGQREAGIRPDRAEWMTELRRGFAGAPHVADHFADPERAFDEMMTLNDGGTGHIARHLGPVCNPAAKQSQVSQRLQRLASSLGSALRPFHTATDLDKRLAERTAMAQTVCEALYVCEERHGRLGSLIGGLLMDSASIADWLYEAAITMDRRPSPASQAGAETPAPGEAASARRRRPWETADSPASSAAGSSPAPSTGTPEVHLARAAITGWTNELYAFAENRHFAAETGIDPTLLRELIDDIVVAVRRLDLQARLVEMIRRVAFADRRDDQIAKATLVCEHILNRFVSDLGTSVTPASERAVNQLGPAPAPVFARRPEAYDASGIGPAPAPYRATFADDWITAYYHLARQNALGTDGLKVDPVQNARLGAVITALDEVAQLEPSRSEAA